MLFHHITKITGHKPIRDLLKRITAAPEVAIIFNAYNQYCVLRDEVAHIITQLMADTF